MVEAVVWRSAGKRVAGAWQQQVFLTFFCTEKGPFSFYRKSAKIHHLILSSMNQPVSQTVSPAVSQLVNECVGSFVRY